MRDAELVTFGGSGLDRAAQHRGNADIIKGLMGQKGAGVVPIWRGKPLLAQCPEGEGEALVWLPAEHEIFAQAKEPAIFLGLDQAGPRFARDVSPWTPENWDAQAAAQFFDPTVYKYPSLPEGQRFAELRGVMTEINPRDAELAATGKSLMEWHRTHRFCAKCGDPSVVTMSGWQRDCPSCGAKHFPRTDPVVIMLITLGNKVLMGRSPGWPEGMYSLLAGFIEPGETIEAAVRREVFEEAGIRVGHVDYLASQPWAFPSSLMMGCRGEALDHDITIDPVEIEHAMWMSREEMMAAFEGTHPVVKPARKGSIAQFILKNWLADNLD